MSDWNGYPLDRPGREEADGVAYPLTGTWTMRPIGYQQQSESQKQEQRDLFARLDAFWDAQLQLPVCGDCREFDWDCRCKCGES